jgi:hypothetical protein
MPLFARQGPKLEFQLKSNLAIPVNQAVSLKSSSRSASAPPTNGDAGPNVGFKTQVRFALKSPGWTSGSMLPRSSTMAGLMEPKSSRLDALPPANGASWHRRIQLLDVEPQQVVEGGFGPSVTPGRKELLGLETAPCVRGASSPTEPLTPRQSAAPPGRTKASKFRPI